MYSVVAYQVANTIQIKTCKQQLPWQLLFQDSDELFYKSSKDSFIYIFHYGLVCFSIWFQPKLKKPLWT